MKLLLCSIVGFVFMATVCAQDSINIHYQKEIASGYHGSIIKNLPVLPEALSFCVIGDWGRYGEYVQKTVAEQLSAAVVGVDASFIISTGDNFYPSGVASEFDPAWKYSFEDVYHSYPTHITWYPVLGNHDYKTNADAEIAYSKLSARWYMPARYFSVKKWIDEEDSTSTIEFFFIDTNPFQSNYYKEHDYKTQVASQDTTAQKHWLDSALEHSTATWKFVVGHHPFYSAGKRHNKTNDMVRSLQPLLEKHKVDAYFCGHEHHLELNTNMNFTFIQIISGAGSEATAVPYAQQSTFAKQDFGFAAVSVNKTEMLISFINNKGTVLYTTRIKKQ